MTEIERICKKGVFPTAFLKAEEICKFEVDELRKKIWVVELDLLNAFIEVCQKYNLRYYLIFGSLLGAVRHHGYIPWDDDLDVSMPREDYEELLRHGDEFAPPYYLQVPGNDHKYFYSHAKLRNSNTSAVDWPFLFSGFNMGIFIDIVPIDNFEPLEGRDRFETIKELVTKNSTYMRLEHPGLSEKDKVRVKDYDGSNPYDTFSEIQRLAQADRCKDTRYVSLLVAPLYGYKRNVFKKADFAEAIQTDFNGLPVNIPIGYDAILKVIYGDYMILPSPDERGVWHSNVVFDPDVPYTYYVEDKSRIKEK